MLSTVRVFASACLALIASASLAQVDYRHAQSPVKNQGARGTCVAFSICAALETFPGVPTKLSEQLLYATVKNNQQSVDRWLRMNGREATIREGDDFMAYVHLFELVGTCSEEFLPYNPNPIRVDRRTPPEIRRFIELAQIEPAQFGAIRDAAGKYGFGPGQWTVHEGDEAKNIQRIKDALDAGVLAIPATYVVHEKPWSDLKNHANFRGDGVRDIIHPGMLEQFAPARGELSSQPGSQTGSQWVDYNRARLQVGGEGLVAAIRDGRWRRRAIYPQSQYSGHAVTIVGYDEIGLIIKNSWGTDWGRNGYARIAFDYHELYATGVLFITGVTLRNPHTGAGISMIDFIQRANWRLKAQRVGPPDHGRLTLSTWALELRDPDVGLIEYTVEGRDAQGRWSVLTTAQIPTDDTERRNGAPLTLTGDLYRRAMACRELRVKVRYALYHPTWRREDAMFVASRSYPSFVPLLGSAVDLSPE